MSQCRKKLIEVALPLDAINAVSAREKSIRHGHPSTLHLWWARRPLAAARAVLWASLVDDPSSHPERFPTEEAQAEERRRLHNILKELVMWENSGNEQILRKARAEIAASMGEDTLVFLDPFAGGGSIPLEAQRLGLEAHAHDLNPVAVMLNKAMIEIPPRFADCRPVNPEANNRRLGVDKEWKRATGLAEDVRYYGEWMKQEAFRRIGHLYPKVQLPPEYGEKKEAAVIAWIWARTVTCPNPACGCEMPLVRSFVLSRKKDNEAWVEPHFADGKASYEVHRTGKPSREGTVDRKGAVCPCCGAPVPFDYIRAQGKAGKMSAQMMAVVAEGERGRLYLSPDATQEKISRVQKPEDYPEAVLPQNPRDFKTPNYGLRTFSDLFTPRQLTVLTTFSDLVAEAQQQAARDALAAGMTDDGRGLADHGCGATAYAQAVGVYLAFVLDKLADYNSSICGWLAARDVIRNTFARQAIPMIWDYAEANPFSNSSGCFDNMLEWVVKCLQELPASHQGTASQQDAQTDSGLRHLVISSDPPYYDNIGYADLADFFYIWMRHSLRQTYPSLFRTMLVPKTEELVATPYRFAGSREKARDFFEDGMLEACRQMHTAAREDVPVTLYYAYKQTESDSEGVASTGWETMLTAIIQAGFTITGTWPMRTEMANRSVASKTNALASSIVLVCRKRPADASLCSRRNFLMELKRELRLALKILQESNIAPVDMAQAAIGPGMAVYSRYAQVLEANGKPMSVRTALQLINQELDLYLAEQEGELDTESRFCVALYSQYAFNDMKFGDADVLARARNTSVDTLARMHLVVAEKGIVHLTERQNLPKAGSRSRETIWLLTQQLTHVMQRSDGGVEGCANVVARLRQQDSSAPDRARDLAYHLYSLAEKKGWTQEAYVYNSLVVAWPDIQSKVTTMNSEDSQLAEGQLEKFLP